MKVLLDFIVNSCHSFTQSGVKDESITCAWGEGGGGGSRKDDDDDDLSKLIKKLGDAFLGKASLESLLLRDKIVKQSIEWSLFFVHS